MRITREQAIAYYKKKKGLPIKRIREFEAFEDHNTVIINDDYAVRLIGKNNRISGCRITKSQLLWVLTTNSVRSVYYWEKGGE